MWDLTLNIVRDSEKRKILGDLTATLVAGFAKLLARDVVLGKKLVFGIEVTDVRGVGLSLKRDQTPPPPSPLRPSQTLFQWQEFLSRRGPETSTLWKIIYNMQSQSYDIRVVPKEEVAYERWSRGGFECSCKWGLH